MKIERILKRIFPLPLSVYLVYLIMCILLLTGVTYSGYITGMTESDAASVASGLTEIVFDSDTVIEMEYQAGEGNEVTENYNFTVSNGKSEVAVQYDIVVTLERTLPDGISVKLDGINCSGNNSNKYTFSDIGSFTAGEKKTNSHCLTFTGNFDVYQMQVETEIPVKISVYARQID